ncbi:hypothetical protein R1sor_004490 [Riccia sorocarpa]|uniref:Uncharacterized protein n=1 Tax=Riccia sorocarpa TaxID=122646 RepID=A0ABD3HKC1_9MARC
MSRFACVLEGHSYLSADQESTMVSVLGLGTSGLPHPSMASFQPQPSMGSEAAHFDDAGMQIKALQQGLKDLTSIIGSCYKKQSKSDQRVRVIHAEIFRDIQLYRALQFKAAVAFITCLLKVISDFTDFSPEQVANSIHIVAQRAADYMDQVQLVRDLHLLFYLDTRDLVERSQQTAKQIRLEAAEHETVANYLGAKAKRHNEKIKKGRAIATLLRAGAIIFAVPTAGVSLVGLFGWAFADAYASHHIRKKRGAIANYDARSASAKDVRRTAAEIKAEHVSNCARTCSDAICVATTFFSNINNQLQTFKQRAENVRSSAEREELNRNLRFHCEKVRGPAANLKSLCEDFLRAVPFIDAEVVRICGGSDISYIQYWIKKHENELGYWKAEKSFRFAAM